MLLRALSLCLMPLATHAGEAHLTFPSIDGGDIVLGQGTPALVVNTASQCGFTYQYSALQALHEDVGEDVIILAVPSDDFGGQEFSDEAEVKAFCEVNFGLTLPMAEITTVRGQEAHPFYSWAADQGARPRWNFHKILVDGSGGYVAEFPSATRPDSARLRAALDRLR